MFVSVMGSTNFAGSSPQHMETKYRGKSDRAGTHFLNLTESDEPFIGRVGSLFFSELENGGGWIRVWKVKNIQAKLN